MRQKFFFLLAGMLVTASAGCRCANHGRQASTPAPQPLPYQFSDHRQNDRGGYYKEQMTITREGGHHDRSKSTNSGGNNLGGVGDNCPPEVNGGVIVPNHPTPSTGGVPTITTPPTMIPSPGIPVPGK